MERKCWVNFQCRGVLLVWMIVGQGPIALAVGAGGGCLDIFSLICLFSFLSPSLWETARYRQILSQRAVKPKTTNQPTIYAPAYSTVRTSPFSCPGHNSKTLWNIFMKLHRCIHHNKTMCHEQGRQLLHFWFLNYIPLI